MSWQRFTISTCTYHHPASIKTVIIFYIAAIQSHFHSHTAFTLSIVQLWSWFILSLFWSLFQYLSIFVKSLCFIVYQRKSQLNCDISELHSHIKPEKKLISWKGKKMSSTCIKLMSLLKSIYVQKVHHISYDFNPTVNLEIFMSLIFSWNPSLIAYTKAF